MLYVKWIFISYFSHERGDVLVSQSFTKRYYKLYGFYTLQPVA